MKILTSARLRLRKLTAKDAKFIVQLLNDSGWHRYIGDHGVKNTEDAIAYIKNGPQTMYKHHDIGLLLVESLEQKIPFGLCGLLKRPKLPFPDLGFAFLPEYRKQGYALEAAKLVLVDAFEQKENKKVLATTSIDNEKSINLLTKLGFVFNQFTDLAGGGVKSKLFELSAENFTHTTTEPE